MRIEKIDDIEVTEYTTGDIALVLRDWELKELKVVLEEWVETHSVVQGPTAADIVRAIREFEKGERND